MSSRTDKIIALVRKNEVSTEQNEENKENFDFQDSLHSFDVDNNVEISFVDCEPHEIELNNESHIEKNIIFDDQTFDGDTEDSLVTLTEMKWYSQDADNNFFPFETSPINDVNPDNSALEKAENQNNWDNSITAVNTSTIRNTSNNDTVETNEPMPEDFDPDLQDDPDYIPSPRRAEKQDSEDTDSDENQLNDDVQEDIAEYGNMSEGRKRRHKADKNEWKKNRNKKLRMEGKEYLGYKKPKGATMTQDIIRPPRSMKSTCTSVACAESKKRMCKKFTEEERQCLFDKFWTELNWDQRKIFVVSHVNRVVPKRRTAGGNSRRNETLNYTLTFNNNKYPVCRKMFLNTLGLGPFTAQSWTKNSSHGMSKCKEVKNIGLVKKNPHQADIDFLKNFLEQLPKLPSHYNRANSSKLYLEPVFKSLTQLYQFYCDHCKNEDRKYLSNKTFYCLFNDTNSSIYQPKKDQCEVCVSHTVGNVSDEEHSIHIQRKDRAHTEKQNDKALAQEQNCIVLTMDLQAVKVCPVVQESSVFFKTKLCCHMSYMSK